MTSYETEHNITAQESGQPPRRRPDLSTFLSSFNHIRTEDNQNPHAEATPGDVAAVLRNAAEWYATLRQDFAEGGEQDDLVSGMIEQLWNAHDHHPEKAKGVSEVFIADLDRVPKKNLKKGDACPICRMPFLDDQYPLVVRLPCHKEHIFDLECLEPWLKMNNSCPLDRKELERKKELPKPHTNNDDEEEEYDDMYA